MLFKELSFKKLVAINNNKVLLNNYKLNLYNISNINIIISKLIYNIRRVLYIEIK